MAISKPKIERFILEKLENKKRVEGLTIYEIYDLIEKEFGENFDSDDNQPSTVNHPTDPEWKHSVKNVIQNLKAKKNKHLGKPIIVHDKKKKLFRFQKINWDENETMIALNLYFSVGRKHVGMSNSEVKRISELLRRLGKQRYGHISSDYRNPAGISQKIGNLMASDPMATSSLRSDSMSEYTWKKYASDPKNLNDITKKIIEDIGVDNSKNIKIKIKDISKNTIESKSKKVKSKEYTKNQPETDLVDNFEKILNKMKVNIKCFSVTTPTTELINDIYLPKTDFLIEAKSNCSREKVREVIGQIKDYAKLFFESEERYPICGALFPEKPIDELIDLLKDQKIFYFCLVGKNDFETNFEGNFK